MALIDRFREASEELRGARKEVQETASVGQSDRDSPMQAARDNGASTTSAEGVDVHRPGHQNPPRIILSDYHYDPPRDEEWHRRLEGSVGPKHEQEFLFQKETGDIYTYRHDSTGNHIHVDSKGNFYDLEDGIEPTLTTRPEVLRAYQEPSPEVAATLNAEHREKWVPLEKEIGFIGADAFSHYGNIGDIQVYGKEVVDSKRLIGLDDKGEFYDVDRSGSAKPISRFDALAYVGVEPSFYTPEERNLREAVGNEKAPDLLSYNRSGDIESFHYVPTGSAIHLDSEGKFYNADRQIITRDEALSTMHLVQGDGLRSIAPAPTYTPEHEGVSHRVAPEMSMSQGTVQPVILRAIHQHVGFVPPRRMPNAHHLQSAQLRPGADVPPAGVHQRLSELLQGRRHRQRRVARSACRFAGTLWRGDAHGIFSPV